MNEIFDSSAKIKQIYDDKREKKAKKAKYPWRELEVGKSFVVRNPNIKFNSLVALAYKTSIRFKRKFVVMEHEPGVYEVGRFADPGFNISKDEKTEQPKTVKLWGDNELKVNEV